MAGSRRGAGAVALAALCLLVGACTPNSGETPSPTPSPSAASPTPTETAIERQERLDFVAAEKSYRAFRHEYRRVLQTGGVSKASTVMRETAGGQYLAEYVPVIQGYKERGYVERGPEKVVFIKRSAHFDDRVTLDVCEDGRKHATYDRSGALIGRGELRTATLSVRKVDGAWKVWSGDGQKVATCSV